MGTCKVDEQEQRCRMPWKLQRAGGAFAEGARRVASSMWHRRGPRGRSPKVSSSSRARWARRLLKSVPR
eukprot:9264901-Lingulodinium_polyedra.AAC.1